MIMRHYLWIGKRRLLHLAVAVLVIGLLAIKVQRASAAVTLVYFHANWQADAETVVLTWATASELETAGFQTGAQYFTEQWLCTDQRR